MKYLNYILLGFVLFTSCKKKVVQTPVQQEQDNFIVESSNREKTRQKLEHDQLNQWVEAHPEYKFEYSPFGYWVFSTADANEDSIRDLDYVQYIKQYKNLNNEIIYSFENLGIQNMILGKTEEIRGIETAIRTMNEGDKKTLLLPSFMAYGLYGDENKIGAHQPILVELEVIKIKKKL